MSRDQIPEKKVVAYLTDDGYVPIEQVFLLGMMIFYWDHERQLCLNQPMTEDSSFNHACKDYLIKMNRDFSSISEAALVAKEEQWPDFELLVDLGNGKLLPKDARFEGTFPPEQIPEEEVLASLTNGGSRQIEHAFLLDGSTTFWDAESQMLLGSMLDNTSLAQARKNYLITAGRNFATMSEVAAVAEAEQWPKFELLVDLANGKPLPWLAVGDLQQKYEEANEETSE